ncbi:MAG: molecular chaperone HtpG, partial [Turneriella sp.]|nr:molecular chaperone HtpG [Turneriella sp.]
TESLRAKGYEILYLLDAYDEIVLQNLGDFSGKKFQSATRAEPDPDSKEKAEAEKKAKEAEKAMGALLGCLREHLKDQVKDVKFSSVLVSAPARLVGEEFDLSPYLERILARNGEKITPRLKTLELNPEHEWIRKLFARYEKNPSDSQLADYAHLLLGYAVIADGGEIRDVARFNQALAGIAVGALQ